MERNKKIITAPHILLAIAVFVWMPYANSSASELKASVSKNVSAIHEEAQAMIKEFSLVYAPPRISADWGERNPFNGGYAAENIPSNQQNNKKNINSVEYTLSGIFWNEQKPSAIINDMVVGVGSMVGLARVQEIVQDKVILNDGNKDVVLMARSGDQ